MISLQTSLPGLAKKFLDNVHSLSTIYPGFPTHVYAVVSFNFRAIKDMFSTTYPVEPEPRISKLQSAAVYTCIPVTSHGFRTKVKHCGDAKVPCESKKEETIISLALY